MATSASLLTITLVMCCSGVVSEHVLHVTTTGSDDIACGLTPTAGCGSLAHALKKIEENGIIWIHGNNSTGPIFYECSNIFIRKSLKIIGTGTVRLGWHEHTTIGHDTRIFSVVGRHKSDSVTVTFQNIILVYGYVYVNNAHAYFDSCSLENSAIRSELPCNHVRITLLNSHVRVNISRALENTETFDSSLMCENVQSDLQNSIFYDVNNYFIANESNHVTITNCTFSKKLDFETGMGGVNITLPHKNGSLDIKNCIFKNIVHYYPISSSINIESSALRIESDATRYKTATATVSVVNSTFADNERAISISSAFKNISLIGCRFVRNVVMHAAGAIRLAISDGNQVLVKDCIFDSNAAGLNRHAPIPGKFEFDGFQIKVKETMVNGIISLVGKGGAVRIHRGHVVFDKCTFTNNTATLLGGAIYLAKNGTMELIECNFENSLDGLQSMQGDVLYSGGQVSIIRNTFNIRTAKGHVSIMRHSGNPWSMDVKSLYFECPIGHRLVMVNNTSHRVEPTVGLMRSYKLDQLYYYCETCGNNQYSVHQGYLNYTVNSPDTDKFYTLLINGSQPFSSHPVDYKYGNITCRECPYGGDCEGDIKSVAKFWGYIADQKINFQHCPSDYCCTSMKCPQIDTCADYRYGRLCGRCRDGYSEGMFSQRCVRNESCDNDWVWVILALIGLVYTLFLITQKDVRDLIGAWSDSLPNLCKTTQANKPLVLFVKKDLNVPEQNNDSCEAIANGNTPLAEYTYTSNINESNQRQNNINAKDSESNDKSGASLIILFYYFQDALLLHVDTVYTKVASELVKRLKSFLVGLFRFRPDFFQFMGDVCIVEDLQPVQKLLIKTLFVPYVLILLGLIFVLYKIVKRIIDMCSPDSIDELPVNNDRDTLQCPQPNTKTPFSCRLASGFTLAMLFTYQKMATATFALLNCVPVGNKSVLFIDGTKECFEGWQYIVMIFAFSSVVPFCVVLMMGPPLLKCNSITVFDFCLGCIVPFPTIFYWIYKHIKNKSKETSASLRPEAETIIEVLQGPFKDSSSSRFIGQFCWAGVLVGRRLILFLCYTFINDVLVRLLCMLCVCFVILMHHMYIKPYKNKKANLAGALSAAALLVVGTINLLRACFEAAEYIPIGPYKFLMEIFEELENTLVLWLPLCGVCIILLAFLVKLTTLMLRSIVKRHDGDLECRITSEITN